MPAILVPEAHTRAGLAVIRSLGRAGHAVHACSPRVDALGFSSRFAHHSDCHPAYMSAAYLPWLRRYVAEHNVVAIIPSSNFLLAIESCHGEFAALLPLNPDAGRVFRCLDKVFIAEFFANCENAAAFRRTQPDHRVVTRPDLDALVLPEATRYGYYLKGCQQDEPGAERSDKGEIARAASEAEARGEAQRLLQKYPGVLIQSGCSGRQVCVGVLLWHGELKAVSVVEDAYPEPHSNGTMSRRRTVDLPDVERDAVARLQALHWHGVAMLEYRREDETGEFNLIEINFRYWQYLHLDLLSGVDFPVLQMACFLGSGPEGADTGVVRSRPGQTSRDTWPGEVAYLVSVWRTRSSLRWRLGQTLDQLFAGCRKDVHNDLLLPGDRRPYWVNLQRFLLAEARSLLRKLRR